METNRLLSLPLLAFALFLSACGGPAAREPASTTGPAPAPIAPSAASIDAGELRSGVAIGPLVLGMRRDEVERIGLPVRPHPSGQMGDNVRLVGPYYVVFGDGRVRSIELTPRDSGTPLRIAGRTLPPTATADEIAAALPACGAMEYGEGGGMRSCDGGRTLVKVGPSCAARGPSGECQRWDPAHPEPSVQVLAR